MRAKVLTAMLAGLFVMAPAAMAAGPAPRASAFTPAQAVADQYTVAPSAAAAVVGPTVAGIAAEAAPLARSQADEGVAAETGVAGVVEDLTPVAGVAPALVERGATAPRSPEGTLPFTGGDLLALVWIALALIVAGLLAEIARRRIEALRG